MNNAQPTKLCPLIGQECLKGGCELYDIRLDNCTIKVLCFNLYQHKEILKEFLACEKAAAEIKPIAEPDGHQVRRFPRKAR